VLRNSTTSAAARMAGISKHRRSDFKKVPDFGGLSYPKTNFLKISLPFAKRNGSQTRAAHGRLTQLRRPLNVESCARGIMIKWLDRNGMGDTKAMFPTARIALAFVAVIGLGVSSRSAHGQQSVDQCIDNCYG
jgi:hypothetical protein